MAKRILVITNHYYPENFKVSDLVEHLRKKLCSRRYWKAKLSSWKNI